MPLKKVRRTVLGTVSWTHQVQSPVGWRMHIIHLWACKRQEGSHDQHRISKANPTWPTWSLSMTKWWTGKVNGNSFCNFYSTKAFVNAFPHILVAEKLWWDKQSFNWAEKWLQHWVPRQYSMAWGGTVVKWNKYSRNGKQSNISSWMMKQNAPSENWLKNCLTHYVIQIQL